MSYDPETPLPDSDLTASEAEADKQQSVTKKANRKWTHADDYSSATMRDGAKSEYFQLDTLPETSRAYLIYMGLTVVLSRTDKATEAFQRLVDGNTWRKPGRVAAPKRDFWREAIAHAFVEATKKAPAGQMTIEAAHEKAKELHKDHVKQLKLDPVVVKHFNKLSGGTIGYSVFAMLAEEAAA